VHGGEDSELDALLLRAFGEATRLGHGWIGIDHFLLAMLDPGDESQAAEALRRSSLSHESYSRAYEQLLGESDPPPPAYEREKGISPSPAVHRCIGRAEGIAIALESTGTTSEHLLVAILWDHRSNIVLERLGVTRDEIIAHLSAQNVRVPALNLPPPAVPAFGERVFVPMDKLDYLAAAIPELLPEGTPFGLNCDSTGRAWVVAGEGIDLPGYVALALSRARNN